MASWHTILRSAGIAPDATDVARTPFETVAACPSAEIVRDTRDDARWYLDFSGEPKASEGLYDAPARSATDADVARVEAERQNALAQSRS